MPLPLLGSELLCFTFGSVPCGQKRHGSRSSMYGWLKISWLKSYPKQEAQVLAFASAAAISAARAAAPTSNPSTLPAKAKKQQDKQQNSRTSNGYLKNPGNSNAHPYTLVCNLSRPRLIAWQPRLANCKACNHSGSVAQVTYGVLLRGVV